MRLFHQKVGGVLISRRKDPGSDDTGVMQTCPLINEAITLLRAELHTNSKINVGRVIDLLQEIREHNSRLRDIAMCNIRQTIIQLQ